MNIFNTILYTLWASQSLFYFWKRYAHHEYYLFCDPEDYRGIIVSEQHRPDWAGAVLFLICFLGIISASFFFMWHVVSSAGQGVTW